MRILLEVISAEGKHVQKKYESNWRIAVQGRPHCGLSSGAPRRETALRGRTDHCRATQTCHRLYRNGSLNRRRARTARGIQTQLEIEFGAHKRLRHPRVAGARSEP